MNMRLACDLCGSQPCMCQTFDCPICEGEGEVVHPHLSAPITPTMISPPDPVMVECEACGGTGEAKCAGPHAKTGLCPFQEAGTDQICRCEAAWDRQQEDMASEPPMTANERHQIAHREREALRHGIPS